ncbi:hypothetical protein GCM10010236_51630 [Streptomyces eurythermus]|nr:hypothetical protein GCM10010236_51630 [Streptomyces eurythermus]
MVRPFAMPGGWSSPADSSRAASRGLVLQGVCAAPEERAGAVEVVETPIRKLIRDHPACMPPRRDTPVDRSNSCR